MQNAETVLDVHFTGEPSASKGCPLGSEEGCAEKARPDHRERDLAAQPILLLDGQTHVVPRRGGAVR